MVVQAAVGVGGEEVDELKIEKTHVAVDEAAVPEPNVTFFHSASQMSRFFTARRWAGALVEYAGQAPSLNKKG